MKLAFDSLEEAKAFFAFVQGTNNQGEKIMGLLEDLKAAQAATKDAIAAVKVNMGEIKDDLSELAGKVAALVALIGQSSGVPQDVVDAANEIKADADSLVASTQGVEDQIKAVPTEPSAG